VKDVNGMTTIIAPVTYDRALRLAVEALKEEFEALVCAGHNQLAPGVVWGEMQNICVNTAEALGYREVDAVIAVRLTRHRLPTPLRDLYDDAMKRATNKVRSERDYVVNYVISSLLRTLTDSLKQIPPL
jgi:hypothetical protein